MPFGWSKEANEWFVTHRFDEQRGSKKRKATTQDADEDSKDPIQEDKTEAPVVEDTAAQIVSWSPPPTTHVIKKVRALPACFLFERSLLLAYRRRSAGEPLASRSRAAGVRLVYCSRACCARSNTSLALSNVGRRVRTTSACSMCTRCLRELTQSPRTGYHTL